MRNSGDGPQFKYHQSGNSTSLTMDPTTIHHINGQQLGYNDMSYPPPPPMFPLPIITKEQEMQQVLNALPDLPSNMKINKTPSLNFTPTSSPALQMSNGQGQPITISIMSQTPTIATNISIMNISRMASFERPDIDASPIFSPQENMPHFATNTRNNSGFSTFFVFVCNMFVHFLFFQKDALLKSLQNSALQQMQFTDRNIKMLTSSYF